MEIELPISKSIANRILILQAMHGDELLPVSNANYPDDVRLLHDILSNTISHKTALDLANCGTAMRFLTAYFAQLPGCEVTLTGCERMLHRPIGQLVDALRTLGADITYLGEVGFPPLRVHGRGLNKEIAATWPQSADLPAGLPIVLNAPLSTQFVSALLLIGVNVQTDSISPYITLTKEIMQNYSSPRGEVRRGFESDWSSAAFWYEYVALHGGELTLRGLAPDSLQGDKVVADIFAQLGVETEFLHKGVRPSYVKITQKGQTPLCKFTQASPISSPSGEVRWGYDFASCPDLYPAVAITCRQMGIRLEATGTDSLRIKESDRLAAVETLSTEHDHRMAMALLAADLPCDDTDCISKSYPNFLTQLRVVQGVERLSNYVTRITPRRGLNDEGKGKKYALRKLIQQADTPYVWLTDDDITAPHTTERIAALDSLAHDGADMYILPLRMSVGTGSILCRLQQAEYAAIQQLTIETARRGHAVMCSGANLLVRRDRWLEVADELHPEIPSGDDMFLLEAFKRRGWRIDTTEDLEVTIDPLPTHCRLIAQRSRWAGKAPHYTDRDILVCGAAILLLNLLQIVCPLILLIKFPIEYTLIHRQDASISLGIALLLELIYPFYILLSLLIGLIHTLHPHHPRW